MAKLFTLSVDTLGSETEINDILKGLNQSLLRNLNYKFQLYGPEEIIKKKIEKYKRLIKVTEIIDCDSYITMEDKPSDILKSKKTSSMYLAIKSVTEHLTDAVLSFGNTGALMSLSLLNIKTLKGIKRPAIASIWPNMKGESVVLDLGANTKLDSRYLIDNSILGASLASILFKIDNPSIGLLNVGKEDNKGKDEIKLASDQLRDLSQNFSVNYYGYIEGNDISTGSTNVVVTDGFTGNIALKTGEGTAKLIGEFVSESFKYDILSKICSIFAIKPLKRLKERMDPRRVNGGVLLGLNGLVVKSHGNADHVGIEAAVKLAIRLTTNSFSQNLSSNLNNVGNKNT